MPPNPPPGVRRGEPGSSPAQNGTSTSAGRAVNQMSPNVNDSQERWSTRRWRPKADAAELCDMLSEGDIILFAGTRTHEGCLQCLLRSEFNHVAMVIKAGDTLESITLHVLESELSQGVSKCPLAYYLEVSRWARLNARFSQIAVRRLFVNGQRLSYQHKVALYRFVAQALGKAYPTSVQGVVTMARAFIRMPARDSGRDSGKRALGEKDGVGAPNADKSGVEPTNGARRPKKDGGCGSGGCGRRSFEQREQAKREYFCSELLAAAYQAMDILDPQRPPESYLPVRASPIWPRHASRRRHHVWPPAGVTTSGRVNPAEPRFRRGSRTSPRATGVVCRSSGAPRSQRRSWWNLTSQQQTPTVRGPPSYLLCALLQPCLILAWRS